MDAGNFGQQHEHAEVDYESEAAEKGVADELV
jgi:hypothetical protein